MVNPMQKTWACLGKTKSPNAVDTLAAGLTVPDRNIQAGTAIALYRRRTLTATTELIRHWHRIEHVHDELDLDLTSLESALQFAFGSEDKQLIENGLGLVGRFRVFKILPKMLEMMGHASLSESSISNAESSLRICVNEVYTRLEQECFTDTVGGIRHDYRDVRQEIIQALHFSCLTLDSIRGQQAVIESIFILGRTTDDAVRYTLMKGPGRGRELAEQFLLTSAHASVFETIFAFLDESHPPSQILNVTRMRDDPPFLERLLEWFPRHPSEFQRRNLKAIDFLSWISPPRLDLELVQDHQRMTCLEFVQATGLSRDDKLRVHEWMLKHGGTEERISATEVLHQMEFDSVQWIVSRSLDSDEPEVQAWATHQLRALKIPEAFTLLVERIDSPIEEVQQAAREELSGFTMASMLALFEHLKPNVCVNAGELLQKIDENALEDLREELHHHSGRRRSRAALAAQSMQLVSAIVPDLLALLEDEEASVRRTAVEVMSTEPNPVCIQAVKSMRRDRSARVRTAARDGLQNLRRHLAEQIEAPHSEVTMATEAPATGVGRS